MGGDQGESIGTQITRLVESAKSFARAEIALAKCTASSWLNQAKVALALLGVVVVLALSAATVLLAALGMALAPWLGVAGGFAVAALIGLTTAAILAGLAIKQLGRIGK